MSKRLSWSFLAVGVLLGISISLLFYCMTTRSPKIEGLSMTFADEFKNLKITLVIFGSSYILRWLSDYYVSPFIIEHGGLVQCQTEFGGDIPIYGDLCCSFFFIMYYTLSSFIWDWLPLYTIMYFHHRSFRMKRAAHLDSSRI